MFTGIKKIQRGSESLLERLESDTNMLNYVLNERDRISIKDELNQEYIVKVIRRLSEVWVTKCEGSNVESCSLYGDIYTEIKNKNYYKIDNSDMGRFIADREIDLEAISSYFSPNTGKYTKDKKECIDDIVKVLDWEEDIFAVRFCDIVISDDTIGAISRCEQLAKWIANEIRKEMGKDLDTKLILRISRELKDGNDVARLTKRLETELSKIKERIISGKELSRSIAVTRVSLANVHALNIIKLVKKGTDGMQNQFTGRCNDITIEAMIGYRNRESKKIGIALVKKIISTESIYPGNGILAYHDKDKGIYSYIMDTVVISEEEEEDIGNHIMESNYRGIHLVKLVLSEGQDLSNSFKAKYI